VAGPNLPTADARQQNVGLFNNPLPAYKRGALCQGRDGRLFWLSPRWSSTSLSSLPVLDDFDAAKDLEIFLSSFTRPQGFLQRDFQITRRPKAIRRFHPYSSV
jgi:hypothetical protein